MSGVRTRREHGLLNLGALHHSGPRAALASLDLTLTLPSGQRVPLYAHEWRSGVISPAGHLHLETFTLVDGLPRWRWRVGDVVVERELAMRHGHPSVAVVHRVISAPEPVGLAVAAMCTSGDAEEVAGGVIVGNAFRIDGPGWQPGGEWHLGARTRQDGGAEDLWFAGTYVDRVRPGGIMEISAWAGPLSERPPAASAVIAEARKRAATGDALTRAADAFVISTPDGPDLVAGYPADEAGTLAAYEGLFLVTGRHDEGRELLRARAFREDEPLWLIHAVDRHVRHTGDTDLAADLAGRLAKRLEALPADPQDELLRLDRGKPVELNALWVNALAALAGLLELAGLDATEPSVRHARARASFAARFRAPEGWLQDVIEGPPATYPLGGGTTHDDASLRPYQLLAWSLPYAPLAGDGPALRALGSSLLTPLGLRTLAPSEYGYQPADSRDGAVRPWLIGPYADACAAAGLPTDGLLAGLAAHLTEAGLGSISDVAHGDPPHVPLGNPFSARSVAEALRVRWTHACEF